MVQMLLYISSGDVSSRGVVMNSHITFHSKVSILSKSVLGAFLRPNGFRKNLFSSRYDVNTFLSFPCCQSLHTGILNWRLASEICALSLTIQDTRPFTSLDTPPWRSHRPAYCIPVQNCVKQPFSQEIMIGSSRSDKTWSMTFIRSISRGFPSSRLRVLSVQRGEGQN